MRKIDDKNYSEEFFCWIYDKTGVAYDLDLHYPIGRVKRDESGNLEKLDSKTYIISEVVEIIKNKIFQIDN